MTKHDYRPFVKKYCCQKFYTKWTLNWCKRNKYEVCMHCQHQGRRLGACWQNASRRNPPSVSATSRSKIPMVPYESYKTLNRLGQPLVTSQRLKAELLVDSDVNQDNCWKMDEGSISFRAVVIFIQSVEVALANRSLCFIFRPWHQVQIVGKRHKPMRFSYILNLTWTIMGDVNAEGCVRNSRT